MKRNRGGAMLPVILLTVALVLALANAANELRHLGEDDDGAKRGSRVS